MPIYVIPLMLSKPPMNLYNSCIHLNGNNFNNLLKFSYLFGACYIISLITTLGYANSRKLEPYFIQVRSNMCKVWQTRAVNYSMTILTERCTLSK